MSKGRVAAKDYSDCTPVMIPVESELYDDLKVWCIRNGIKTSKEKLHEIVNDGIREVLKSGK